MLLGTLSSHRGYPCYPGYANVGIVTAVGPGVEQPAVGRRALTTGRHASHFLLDLSPTRPAYWEPVPEPLPSEWGAGGW